MEWAVRIGLVFACFGLAVGLQVAIVAGAAAGAWRALSGKTQSAADVFS
jgi:hypothetical protein